MTVGPTFQLDCRSTPPRASGFISIDASRDVVSLGEHFQYDVRVENPGVIGAPLGVDVTRRAAARHPLPARQRAHRRREAARPGDLARTAAR